MTASGEIWNGTIVCVAYGAPCVVAVVIFGLIWRDSIAPRLRQGPRNARTGLSVSGEPAERTRTQPGASRP